MTTYYNQSEIIAAMHQLVNEYLKQCKNCKEIPEDFVELLRHNFLAKFVCYNAETNNIEIGVENYSEEDLYDSIKIYKYSLDADNSWLGKSFKRGKNDLAFYGKLLSRRKSFNDVEVIVM